MYVSVGHTHNHCSWNNGERIPFELWNPQPCSLWMLPAFSFRSIEVPHSNQSAVPHSYKRDRSICIWHQPGSQPSPLQHLIQRHQLPHCERWSLFAAIQDLQIAPVIPLLLYSSPIESNRHAMEPTVSMMAEELRMRWRAAAHDRERRLTWCRCSCCPQCCICSTQHTRWSCLPVMQSVWPE
jgi:hypothetical protein